MKREFSTEELEEILPTIMELIMNEQLIIVAHSEGTIGVCMAPTITESSPSINGNAIQIDMRDLVADISEKE